MIQSSRLLLIALLLGSSVSAACAENWPEFRGPRGDGSSLSENLPLTWSDKENIRWKTPLPGKAWSSPVVWDNQIWLTNAPPDGKQLFAVCIDRESGKIEKNIKVFEIAEPQYCIEKNSYASCTPAIEAGRIYVHYGVHGTAAIDTASGETIWARQDLPCNHHRGPASSVVLYKNLVILTFDGFDLQYVVALDKANGKTVWKTDRNTKYSSDNGDIMKAYSTPQIIEVAGKAQLVSPSSAAAISYDPESGKELWRVMVGGMNAACRPIYGQGMVFMTAPDGGCGLYALKPDGTGDVTGNIAWKQPKGYPKRASLTLIGDWIFMGNDQGIICCVEAATGEVLWQERVGGVFTASPISAPGRVYFFAEDGTTVVIAADKEFKQLAKNKVDDGFMASPAVAGNAIILRTLGHVYCVEQ